MSKGVYTIIIDGLRVYGYNYSNPWPFGVPPLIGRVGASSWLIYMSGYRNVSTRFFFTVTSRYFTGMHTCHRDYLTRTREAGFAKENNGRGSVAPLSRLLQLVRAALC